MVKRIACTYTIESFNLRNSWQARKNVEKHFGACVIQEEQKTQDLFEQLMFVPDYSSTWMHSLINAILFCKFFLKNSKTCQ